MNTAKAVNIFSGVFTSSRFKWDSLSFSFSGPAKQIKLHGPVKDDYQLEKVIVCNVGDSKWHDRWEGKKSGPTFKGFLRSDKIPPLEGKTNFTDTYNTICEQVRKV